MRLDLLYLSPEGKSTKEEWKLREQYYNSIWSFLINGKIQSWNGLPTPKCHLITEIVQEKAGFSTGRSLNILHF